MPRRRALVRGPLVGVGLLALTASGGSVAVADDEADLAPPAPEADLDGVPDSAPVLNPDVPAPDVARAASSIEGFFGRGKTVGFQVDYDATTGAAPAGLDLSGAVFTLTGNGQTFDCTTGPTGSCSVTSNDTGGDVPPSTYSVTQTAHAVGLAGATGTGSVHVCSFLDGFFGTCGGDSFETVVNDPTFRTPVVTIVEDAVTGAPIAGAGYALTGPGFAYAASGDAAASATAPARQEIRATSAADGSLTFSGWFAPDTSYVLAPVSTVDGYQADAETSGIEIAPSTGTLPASLAPRLLTPIGGPAPVTPVGTTPTVPVPAPVAAPAGIGSPAPGRPGRAAAPVEPITPEPLAPAAPSATASFDRSGATEPTTAPLAGGPAAPALTTVSSNLPDRGLAMALGGVFLTAILVGIGLVRRHARRRA
ncbi:hypothetical protein [Blastococcus sp. CT_GayMR16]|uniref:hypothetical protein n=1 Tax=Blastococcus sp. CT_GayMR16 TaxID=2559607 RepID=UPI0010739FF1|nr:hypothetical protein [Blastococcus sp. CT_GayMR16]TFV91359.1 hypothetical protein E4P38_01850 [Blastococcus sp. CT_GayMR16]